MFLRLKLDFCFNYILGETLTMTVQPEEYMPKTVEYCHFLNRFIVRVRETEQLWTGEDDFILEKPKLDIRIIPVSSSFIAGRGRYISKNWNLLMLIPPFFPTFRILRELRGQPKFIFDWLIHWI